MTAVLTAAARQRKAACIISAPGAAAALGAEVFAAMTAEAARRVPAAVATFVLDCDDAPGHALAAVRAGIRHLRVRLREPALRRVADAAARAGASIDRSEEPALDLGICADHAIQAENRLSRP